MFFASPSVPLRQRRGKRTRLRFVEFAVSEGIRFIIKAKIRFLILGTDIIGVSAPFSNFGKGWGWGNYHKREAHSLGVGGVCLKYGALFKMGNSGFGIFELP